MLIKWFSDRHRDSDWMNDRDLYRHKDKTDKNREKEKDNVISVRVRVRDKDNNWERNWLRDK